MAAITLKGVPEELMDRLRTLADEERRSLNQQAILLLERAVAETPRDFGTVYDQFREEHGSSPLEESDLEDLRDETEGRPVEL